MGHLDTTILLQKAAGIRLLCLDCDGVLTSGDITYTTSGEQVVTFSVRDGLGLRLLMEAGVEVAILTSRSSAALERRVRELGIGRLEQGVGEKGGAFRRLVEEMGLSPQEAAYMGDDWVDLPALRLAGLAAVPADAAYPLADHAHMITRAPGGRGAVRELCDLILRAKGLWGPMLNRFLGE